MLTLLNTFQTYCNSIALGREVTNVKPNQPKTISVTYISITLGLWPIFVA